MRCIFLAISALGGYMDNSHETEKITSPLPPKKPRASFIIDILDTVVKAFVIVIILVTFIVSVPTVHGTSMCNTLQNGDRLIISDLFYTPKEGDIVVAHETGALNEPIVKRIIATGGKWVKIDYDRSLVYVSDDNVFDESEIIDESSYVFLTNGKYNQSGSKVYEVPEGCVFLMGDNRNVSRDSREMSVGCLEVERIIGKVYFRIYPFDSIGFVE